MSGAVHDHHAGSDRHRGRHRSVRSRGDQLLDLWRRSRDLDRSLGLYRDACDLSCSGLDCHSLDRDRHCSRGRSCLLEYIGGSPERSRQRSTRINGRAGADLRLGENPSREPRTKKGSEVYGSNTTTRCRREITPFTLGHTSPKSSSHSRTPFGSGITQRRWTLHTNWSGQNSCRTEPGDDHFRLKQFREAAQETAHKRTQRCALKQPH